jgi:predicted metal-dependent HD superfamily phosphohydrolase
MVPERFPDLWADLQAAYGLGPERVYHAWSHIQSMLKGFEAVRPALAAPDAAELAICYHDVVYDPLAHDNEALSARRLEADLAGRASADVVRLASALVMATHGHRVPEEMGATEAADCSFFLDLDLAILGSDPPAFAVYDHAIRCEYAHVSPADYAVGRAYILGEFQKRPRLYFSDAFQRTLEEPARANLARAISELGREEPEPEAQYRSLAGEPGDLADAPLVLHRHRVAWFYLADLFAPGPFSGTGYVAHGLLHTGYSIDALEEILVRELLPVLGGREADAIPDLAALETAIRGQTPRARRGKLPSALATRWDGVRASMRRSAKERGLAAL